MLNLGHLGRRRLPAAEAVQGLTARADRMGRRATELRQVVRAAVRNTPPLLDELTYRDVVVFFVDHRAEAPTATCGALLSEPMGGRRLVRLFFLDDEGTPLVDGQHTAPHRTYSVDRLDDTLVSLLRDGDIVLFT